MIVAHITTAAAALGHAIAPQLFSHSPLHLRFLLPLLPTQTLECKGHFDFSYNTVNHERNETYIRKYIPVRYRFFIGR